MNRAILASLFIVLGWWVFYQLGRIRERELNAEERLANKP
jgi:hypothetical protein